jgi:hypothetical protein
MDSYLRRSGKFKHLGYSRNYIKPIKMMTISEKNNRNYREAWENIGFNEEGPEDCEHEHPLTGKCMSHYDYQVWLNRERRK